MFNFRISSELSSTRLTQRNGEVELSYISIPDSKLRGVAKSLTALADAKDLIKSINWDDFKPKETP
jgi:hypothetical protein